MHFSHLEDHGSARFHFPGPHHGSVFVTGSFCEWSQHGVAMRREPEGWFAEVSSLPPGDVEYKFVVDGRWVPDPRNLTAAPDGRGGHNSLLPRDGRGTSHAFSFHSPALGRARAYAVHLPTGHASGRRFPTLYLLHGALDGERAWLERGAFEATVARLRGEGALGEMIVVMPFEPGDLFRGDERVADYLIRDVMGHVDFEFPTLASPRHRAIDGLSTGGFTSLALGARHPGAFRSVGSMSGSYDGRLARAVDESGPAMREADQRHLLSCGRDEPHLRSCQGMFERLRGLGLSASWLDAPGIHDWPVWRELLGAHLRFHWENVRA